MAKQQGAAARSAQLDAAVEAMMADRDAAPIDPQLAALLEIAAALRDLPTADFKARLKADLQRGGSAARPVPARPPGYHTATPCLVVPDAPDAIAFYKRAFGASEVMRLADPAGHIVHAEIQIGDSRVAIAGEVPEWGNLSPQALGGSPVIVQLYVDDVDALAAQAVAAGARVIFPVADQFYGDRAGRLADPFGHVWIVATHVEDVTPEQMQERAQAWMAHDEATAAHAAPADTYRVEPLLRVAGAAHLIEFLEQAFGAQQIARHTDADGRIAHAALRIGDTAVSIGDATADAGPMPTAMHLYVPDVDAAYQRALRAGASATQAPTNQDYGDREAGVTDAFGNHWYIATHTAEGTRTPPHIPEGLPALMSYLHPKGTPRLIEFLERAFDAHEAFRAQAPDGTVVYAKVRIGGSVVEMGEAHGPYQPMPAIYHLYVTDTDSVYRRALAVGGRSLRAPANQPWGFRNAGVEDPCGNQWWITAPITPAATSEAAPATETAAAPRAVTPFLQVHDVRQAVDFLQAAFGAELVLFDRGGDPPHDHAEIRIGESRLMAGEVIPGFSPTASAFYLSVADADEAYQRALRAGAASQQPPTDMPWGDRMAHVKDPFGNSWYVASAKK